MLRDQFEVPYHPSIASYIAGNYLVLRKVFASDEVWSEYRDDINAAPVEIRLVFNQVASVPLLLESEVDQLAVKIETVLSMYTLGCRMSTS